MHFCLHKAFIFQRAFKSFTKRHLHMGVKLAAFFQNYTLASTKIRTCPETKMIISQNPRLLSHLCMLAHFTRNLEIKFNPNTSQVTVDGDSNMVSISKWRYVLSVVLSIIYILQLVFEGDNSQPESVLAWVLLIMIVAGHTYVIDIRRKASEIRDCINALHQLNFILPDKSEKQPLLLLKLYVAFVYTTVVTALILPAMIVHGLHWINPCKPTLVGYWIIPSCQPKVVDSSVDILVQACVILMNHWLWSFIVHATVFGASSIHILAVISIQQFIQRFVVNR